MQDNDSTELTTGEATALMRSLRQRIEATGRDPLADAEYLALRAQVNDLLAADIDDWKRENFGHNQQADGYSEEDEPATAAEVLDRLHELRQRYEITSNAADRAAIGHLEKLLDRFIATNLAEIDREKRDEVLSVRFGEVETERE